MSSEQPAAFRAVARPERKGELAPPPVGRVLDREHPLRGALKRRKPPGNPRQRGDDLGGAVTGRKLPMAAIEHSRCDLPAILDEGQHYNDYLTFDQSQIKR